MGEAVGDRVRACLARGDQDAATTAALEALGPAVFGYLSAILEEDEAHDAYSFFEEDVWRGIATWRGEGSFRAWAYRVAWNAARRVLRDTYRRRRERLRSSAASRLPAPLPSSSRLGRSARLEALRELRATLSPEEQSLLVLHVDRELDWAEVATVLGDGRRVSEAALRKRFQRLKDRLAATARRKGLVT